MNIGKLRHRLVLQSPTQTQGDTGQVTFTYSTSETVWGSLRPMTGKEISSANKTTAEYNFQAMIRYYSGIDTTWRVVDANSVTYEITAVLNYDERNEYQILELKKIA